MAWRMAKSLGATGTEGLLGEINARAPKRKKASDGGIGDTAHSKSKSDHNPCGCHSVVCARDFTHDPAGGFDANAFAEWLRARVVSGEEKRVKYVIWNKRIFSGPGQGKPPGEWRPYTGKNPHDKHVHVSVVHHEHDNAGPWGWHPQGAAPA
jgi:hypothetical protein